MASSEFGTGCILMYQMWGLAVGWAKCAVQNLRGGKSSNDTEAILTPQQWGSHLRATPWLTHGRQHRSACRLQSFNLNARGIYKGQTPCKEFRVLEQRTAAARATPPLLHCLSAPGCASATPSSLSEASPSRRRASSIAPRAAALAAMWPRCPNIQEPETGASSTGRPSNVAQISFSSSAIAHQCLYRCLVGKC